MWFLISRTGFSPCQRECCCQFCFSFPSSLGRAGRVGVDVSGGGVWLIDWLMEVCSVVVVVIGVDCSRSGRVYHA